MHDCVTAALAYSTAHACHEVPHGCGLLRALRLHKPHVERPGKAVWVMLCYVMSAAAAAAAVPTRRE